MPNPIPCPECGTPMARNGRPRTGRKRKQRWLCRNCGRTRITKLEEET